MDKQVEVKQLPTTHQAPFSVDFLSHMQELLASSLGRTLRVYGVPETVIDKVDLLTFSFYLMPYYDCPQDWEVDRGAEPFYQELGRLVTGMVEGVGALEELTRAKVANSSGQERA